MILSYDRADAPERFILQSVTKPIVGLAVLALVNDGHLESFDQPVYTLYPEWRQGRKKQITVRHILTHTTGLQNEPYMQAELTHLPDRVQAALAADVIEDPGTVARYNNKAYGLLAGIIERASGEKAEEYIQRRIFAPLNISAARWEYDPSGKNLSVIGGLQLNADELGRIGQLLLQEGQYDGRQVIRADLVREALSPQVADGPANYRGLGWLLGRRITRVVFGDSALAVIKASPLDSAFVDRAARLRGEYRHYLEFRDRVAEVFGSTAEFDDPLQANEVSVVRAMTIEREEVPSFVFHSGDGGQFLFVLPDRGIVAVRLIRDLFTEITESPEFKGKDTSDPEIGARLWERFEAVNNATGFWNFTWLVLALPES